MRQSVREYDTQTYQHIPLTHPCPKTMINKKEHQSAHIIPTHLLCEIEYAPSFLNHFFPKTGQKRKKKVRAQFHYADV